VSTSGNRTFPACLAPLCPAALGSVSAELKEAGLFRVQAERELCQALLEIDQETLRYGSAYAGLRLCHGFPTLCPDRALQFRIPLGPIVSLHRLRGGRRRCTRQFLLFFHQRGNPIGAIYPFGTWQGAIEFQVGSCWISSCRKRTPQIYGSITSTAARSAMRSGSGFARRSGEKL
jgi:hypothetical protein